MKIRVVASDLPHPQGSAAGRDLWAWCEAARTLGHDLQAWIWFIPPASPTAPVPDWADYRPVSRTTPWGTFVTSAQAKSVGFDPEPDAVVVADHLPSAGALVGKPHSVLTLHYRALLDAKGVRQLRRWHLRTAYEEIHLSRQVSAVLAYSERVGRLAGRPAHIVPFTAPLPEDPLPIVDEPVAVLLANWGWRPNLAALDTLLGVWPEVRRRVPGARLVLGGHNFPDTALGSLAGVERVGPVPDSTEVLAGAAVLAFPCPSSSGPKAKVLEALALGLPVVTTSPGMEGIRLRAGGNAMVARRGDFALRLASLLRDPQQRAELASIGRASIFAYHSPEMAADLKLRIFAEAFDI